MRGTSRTRGNKRLPVWQTSFPSRIRRRIRTDVSAVTRRQTMVDGGATRHLEGLFREVFGRYAVAAASGMDGLELLLEHYGARRGRTVVVPSNCFPSVPALAQQLGARLVAGPVDPTYLCIAPGVLRDQVVQESPIVVWVHHAGIVADYAMQAIVQLREAGCTVVEDCVYMLPGATPAGGPGTWGDGAVFSFHPIKPLGAAGGAVILSRDGRIADQLAARRSHSGQERLWQDGDALYRGRQITEFAAAAAVAQFSYRNRIQRALAPLAEVYASALPRWLPAGRTPQPTWGRFTIRTGSTGEALRLRNQLHSQNIDSNVMFSTPWTTYPIFAGIAGTAQPELLNIMRRNVCIPYHAAMSKSDANRVSAAITDSLDWAGHD
ncbi:DegT/DnrJ/EryC1/StrS family aminotransferase [Streptomyces sp. NPDC050982]|uniref:DegT/DnrJ/EryC1/StrS family aminotransferase n=1 Tax=Streptomyces sp. NPDC050982 TaxID=3154746 RepID=UPI0033F9603A